MDEVISEALDRAEEMGIVFLDEIDKIAGRARGGRGRTCPARGCSATCSRSSRAPRCRPSTDGPHRPRPLHRRRRLPRLQAVGPDPGAAGPLPDPRGAEEPHRGRLRPHPAGAEERAAHAVPGAGRRRGRKADFTDDGVDAIAKTAATLNDRMENIGARRLHTVLTTLLEDLLFDLPDAGTEKRPSPSTRTRCADRLKASWRTRTCVQGDAVIRLVEEHLIPERAVVVALR
jgi:ATP-dependent HslUV protease ATP-binding subunit HslU